MASSSPSTTMQSMLPSNMNPTSAMRIPMPPISPLSQNSPTEATQDSPARLPATNSNPATYFPSLARIKLSELKPADGPASSVYSRAVEKLSQSLNSYNAAIIQVSDEDSALIKCSLYSSKLYFKSKTGASIGSIDWNKSGGYYAAPFKDMYFYRAGRLLTLEEHETSPASFSEVFTSLGKTSRIILSSLSRYLKLRNDSFSSLLDDIPLQPGDVSSSVLTSTCHHCTSPAAQSPNEETAQSQAEVEKGMLMLISSDSPGLQVCDKDGNWYLADRGVSPGELLLLVGRTFEQCTAGYFYPSTYRIVPPLKSEVYSSGSGRCSIAFRLMPRLHSTIDCSIMSQAGHDVAEKYKTSIQVSDFFDSMTASDVAVGKRPNEASLCAPSLFDKDPSLRSLLTDPYSKSFLDDAVISNCGHSFGGQALRNVMNTLVCCWCGERVDVHSLIPNLTLRSAVSAFKREQEYLLKQSAERLAKRRRDRESIYSEKSYYYHNQENGVKEEDIMMGSDYGNSKSFNNSSMVENNQQLVIVSNDGMKSSLKGIQFPFKVNDSVLITGNKRTPPRFIGKEAIIVSQCLNGWYLVRIQDTGESLRVQYRSLTKISSESPLQSIPSSERSYPIFPGDLPQPKRRRSFPIYSSPLTPAPPASQTPLAPKTEPNKNPSSGLNILSKEALDTPPSDSPPKFSSSPSPPHPSSPSSSPLVSIDKLNAGSSIPEPASEPKDELVSASDSPTDIHEPKSTEPSDLVSDPVKETVEDAVMDDVLVTPSATDLDSEKNLNDSKEEILNSNSKSINEVENDEINIVSEDVDI